MCALIKQWALIRRGHLYLCIDFTSTRSVDVFTSIEDCSFDTKTLFTSTFHRTNNNEITANLNMAYIYSLSSC